jgi:hypothetical protein
MSAHRPYRGVGPSQETQRQGSGMRTELISIETDTLPLGGAFYLPDGAAQ